MKKLVLGLAAVAMIAAAPAHAQYYNRNGGYHGGGYHGDGYHGGGGGWVAPLLGGVIIGGIIGGAMAAPPPVMYFAPPRPQECWQEFLYHDQWNRAVFRTVCR